MGDSMSLLRSLFISTPLIVICTVVMGTLSLIDSFFDNTGDSLHGLARAWARMLLAVSFMRVRVEGAEKLDPRGPYVFVANHGSYMDIPALLAICTRSRSSRRGVERISAEELDIAYPSNGLVTSAKPIASSPTAQASRRANSGPGAKV